MKKNNTVLAGSLLVGISLYFIYGKKEEEKIEAIKTSAPTNLTNKIETNELLIAPRLYEKSYGSSLGRSNAEYPLDSNQQPVKTGGDSDVPPTVIETGKPLYTYAGIPEQKTDNLFVYRKSKYKDEI
jgi:hypothetical protein